MTFSRGGTKLASKNIQFRTKFTVLVDFVLTKLLWKPGQVVESAGHAHGDEANDITEKHSKDRASEIAGGGSASNCIDIDDILS